jgi:methylenetetrahydrofolate reductase (NADPH)
LWHNVLPMPDVNAPNPLKEAFGAGRFIYGAELVTTRGAVAPGSADKLVALGEAFCAIPRITWVSVTDNPSGIPMLPPDWMGRTLGKKKEVLVHLTCKDRNRSALESSAWSFASEGFRTVLALSGDIPQAGYGGQPRRVFDLDSVGLISLLKAMNSGPTIPGRIGGPPAPTDFLIGAAVSPFKLTEEELVPQYMKLLRKLAAGAAFVMPQLGYDMRKFHEIRLFLDSRGIKVPVIGNVYLLTRQVAGLFNKGQFPGCVVSDGLLALAEKYAAGPDGGKAFFHELAAKQLAVFRGLGFAGGYLAGLASGDAFDGIVDMAEGFGQDDWKVFAKEIQFARGGEFYLFRQDPETGLGMPGRLDPGYEASLKKPRAGKYVTPGYRASRVVHSLAFTRDRGLFGLLRRIYARWDGKPGILSKVTYLAEKAGKVVLYECKDCGDCSLPDCAYVCPMSQCAKNQRNGPCGGSNEGICETKERTCIWVRAYQRLKYYGELEELFSRPAVYYDAGLEGTSSWANTFLGRDHSAWPKAFVQKVEVKRVAIPGLKLIGESINDSIPSTNKLYSANDLGGTQDLGGADWIDVNVGRRTPAFMAEMVGRVQSVTTKPLSIDTPDVEIARAGLTAFDPGKAGGRLPILNSVSLLRTQMFDIYKTRRFMPILLVSERVEGGQYKANHTAEETYRSAKELLAIARERTGGIPNGELIVDPGIGPVGSDTEGLLKRVLDTIRMIHDDADFRGVHVSVGLSNFTHMLPLKRADGSPVKSPLESAFLTMAMPMGLDMIIGSVKRKYELLAPDHPAMTCLSDVLKLEGIEAVERVQQFYAE